MKWLLMVTGVLTCTMVYAAIAPQAALQSMFGATVQGPVAEIVVRNWGALITLVGLTMIYGAVVPPARRLVLSVAVLSKATFVTLVLIYGRESLARLAGPAVIADSLCVLVFGYYLLNTKHPAR
jgi:hypothetical protein